MGLRVFGGGSVGSGGDRIYGKTGGRTLTAALDKEGGSQSLTGWAVTAVTYPKRTKATGLHLTTANAITIPEGAGGQYLAVWMNKWTGASATAGLRKYQLLVNGVSAPAIQDAYAPGGNDGGTHSSSAILYLKDGDVVTAQVVTPSNNVTLRGDFPNDSVLSLTRLTPIPVQSIPIGHTGVDIPGISQRQAGGTWTSRNDWNAVAQISELNNSVDYTAFKAAKPNGLSNIATALIPHDQNSATWNTLLDEVIAGTHDSVFTTQGQRLAAHATTDVVIRPWWEMNMDNTTIIDPARFAAAWNRAVPLIRSAFAAAAPTKRLRVAFCYLDAGASDGKLFYPGDTNVDIIDVDLYARIWGSSVPTEATLLNAIRTRLDYAAVFAAEHGKPVGISEWGNWEEGTGGVTADHGRGDLPEFIDMVFDWLEQNQAEYALYYNILAGPNLTFANMPLSQARYVERANALTA